MRSRRHHLHRRPPWGARVLDDIDGVAVRLHWTDQPYEWHINDGPDVVVVLCDTVNMHCLQGGLEDIEQLISGLVWQAEPEDEHVAYPAPEAGILVIECKGSV
jgi:hypothetical protein